MKAWKMERKNGFTMIEVLFASSCSLLVVGGALGLFIMLSRLFSAGSTQMRLTSEARYGMERIAADVRGAELITVSSSGDQISLTIPATNLSSDISSSATTIPVDSTDRLPSSGAIYIGTEVILYNGITAKGQSNPQIYSCTRGYNGTSAASHKDNEVVYVIPAYYLSGSTVYLSTSGTPNTATDGILLKNVEKISGTYLFQQIAVGTSSYKKNRVQITFRCFQDKDKDHLRDLNEPGVDFSMELFPRNKS